MFFVVVLFLFVILASGTAAVSAQQTQGQCQTSVSSDNNGGYIVTNADCTKVAVSASALAQLQVQTQSGGAVTSTVPVTGPVTPLYVNVAPGEVTINKVTATGTTKVVVPVTTTTKKTVPKYKLVKCKWKIVGTKLISVTDTKDKEITGSVEVDLTPAVQEAVGISKAYSDQQNAAMMAQINDQRQTATIAVPVFAPQQQTQSQSQVATKPPKVKDTRSFCERHPGFCKLGKGLLIGGAAVGGTYLVVKAVKGSGRLPGRITRIPTGGLAKR